MLIVRALKFIRFVFSLCFSFISYVHSVVNLSIRVYVHRRCVHVHTSAGRLKAAHSLGLGVSIIISIKPSTKRMIKCYNCQGLPSWKQPHTALPRKV